MSRREVAEAAFLQGYNCSQSLLYAFADLLPVDRGTAMRLASSFGGGMGRLREVCGAVSGSFMVLGMLCGYEGPETGDIKAEHYARIQAFAHRYEAKNDTIICKQLLHRDREGFVPEARTEAYYTNRPCKRLIGDAAELLEAMLREEGIITD